MIESKLHCQNIGAVELRNSLSSRFNLDLPSTVIFDYPTAQGLAAFINGKQQGPEAFEDAGSEDSQDDVSETAAKDAVNITTIR